MRRNPTIDKSNKGLKPVMDGIDNLPNPAGTNQDALSEANAMPDVDMSTNDGSNPKIADAASSFPANKDVKTPSGNRDSNPYPGKVGADK